jgi:hypothetical protein
MWINPDDLSSEVCSWQLAVGSPESGSRADVLARQPEILQTANSLVSPEDRNP